MREHKDIEMTPELHLKSLKLIREIIANSSKIMYYDDTTPGNKHTECSWGLCTDAKEAWPDSEMHLWPDQFEEKGRVAPKYHKKDQVCPLDTRSIEADHSNGCFYTCQAFKRKKRKQPLTKEYVLQLFDTEIQRYEGLLANDKVIR
jgi:hypothetical protein